MAKATDLTLRATDFRTLMEEEVRFMRAVLTATKVLAGRSGHERTIVHLAELGEYLADTIDGECANFRKEISATDLETSHE